MTRLIQAAELRSLVGQPRGPLLLDARTAGDYARGHIPGAINVDSYDLMPEDTTPRGMTVLHEKINARYRILGNFEKVEFIIYGNWNDLRACRSYWLMVYSGHVGARLLDGGMEAWAAAGGPVTTEVPETDPTNFGVRSRREVLARIDEVEAAIDDPRSVIVDVRDEDEFQGRRTPDCDPRPGRISGAVHFPWGRFFDAGGKRFGDVDALRPALEEAGLDPGKTIIPYCHRGARAAAAWLGLKLLGYRKVKSFLGSWHEWSRKRGEA